MLPGGCDLWHERNRSTFFQFFPEPSIGQFANDVNRRAEERKYSLNKRTGFKGKLAENARREEGRQNDNDM
jgi:hypothetical protein